MSSFLKKDTSKVQYSFSDRRKDLIFQFRRGKGHIMRYILDRMIWKWYPRFRIVRHFPEHVDLELSSICNMQCPMCYTTLDAFKNQKRTFMELNLFKRLINECVKGKAFSIRLSIRGEPLMHPNFMECVDYVKEKGIKEVSFLTNASLLDENTARAIVEAKVDWVTISFDGVGETYNNIRKPAKYIDALKRVKDFISIRNEYGKGKPAIKIQTIWDAVKDDPNAYKDVFCDLADMVAFNMYVDYEGSGEHDPKYFCKSPWERMVVYADGLVPKCTNDPFSKDIMGDVNKQTLQDIWSGPTMRKAREDIAALKWCEYGSCMECSYRIKTIKVDLAVGRGYIAAGKRGIDFGAKSA